MTDQLTAVNVKRDHPLVFENKGEVVTDSLTITQMFGKTHDNVLKDIRKQIEYAGEEFSLVNFHESKYMSRGKEYPKYNLTEEAFTLVAMSYNTKEAVQMKIKFIEEFKRMKGYIQSKQQKGQRKPRKKSVNLIFRQEMDMAKTLASMAGVKEGIAYAVAIERAEKKTGEDFSSYKRLLPTAAHETGFLNPTKIGEQMGKKSRVVNKLLQERGLQEKLDKEWCLTEEGKKYGEEMPYTRNGHSGYQIKWNESVIDVLSAPEVMQ